MFSIIGRMSDSGMSSPQAVELQAQAAVVAAVQADAQVVGARQRGEALDVVRGDRGDTSSM